MNDEIGEIICHIDHKVKIEDLRCPKCVVLDEKELGVSYEMETDRLVNALREFMDDDKIDNIRRGR